MGDRVESDRMGLFKYIQWTPFAPVVRDPISHQTVNLHLILVFGTMLFLLLRVPLSNILAEK